MKKDKKLLFTSSFGTGMSSAKVIFLVKVYFSGLIYTMGAQIPNVLIQNPFKIRFWRLDLGWFSIRMIVTMTAPKAVVLTLQKWKQHIGIQNGDYLFRFRMVRLFGFGILIKIWTWWVFKLVTLQTLNSLLTTKEYSGVTMLDQSNF